MTKGKPSRFTNLIAAGVLVVFVLGAIVWFVVTTSGGDEAISAGDVFVGLGYMAGVLFVALAAMLGWRLLSLIGSPATWPRRRRDAGNDHSIIRTQLAWGSSLVMVGAVLGAICLCFVHPSDALAGPVLALATAVISAGAVLLPAGAASSASGRIQQSLGAGGVPTVLAPTVTRVSDSTAQLLGTVIPNGTELEAYFEYQAMPSGVEGEQPAAIARAWPTEHIAAATPAQAMSAVLDTLDAGTAYQVRLVAKPQTGKAITSAWVTLAVVTAAPADPGQDKAEGEDDAAGDAAPET